MSLFEMASLKSTSNGRSFGMNTAIRGQTSKMSHFQLLMITELESRTSVP